MSFSESQIQQFRDHGWLAVPDFWDRRETAAMQAEVARFKRDGLLANVTTEGDGRTRSGSRQNLQLCPMSPHSLLFHALPFAPKVIAAVRQLIGDPIVLHLDQVFLKPSRHGSGTNWHQDNAYFQISDPLKGTAMWTAVHQATVANGTIEIIPDSHKTRFEHSRDMDSNHHIRCYPPEGQAIPVELPAGGAVFFAYGVAHCTRGNTTEADRAGAAFHFLNGDIILPDYFSADASMAHPILSGPQADPEVQEGGHLWQQAIAQALEGAVPAAAR